MVPTLSDVDRGYYRQPLVVENTYIKKPKYPKPETSQEKYARLRAEKRRARAIRNGKYGLGNL